MDSSNKKIKNKSAFITGICTLVIGIAWLIINLFIPNSEELGVGGYLIPIMLLIAGFYSIYHAFTSKTATEIQNEVIESVLEPELKGAFESEDAKDERAELISIINLVTENEDNTEEALERIEALLLKCKSPKDHSAVLFAKALCYEDTDTEMALSIYREVLTYNPDSPEMLYYTASILSQNGNLDEAIEHYKRAILNDPDGEFYNYSIARDLTKLGRYEESNKYCERELEIQKKFYGAYAILAVNYTALGNDELAEKYAKTARSKGQDKEALDALLSAAKAKEEIPFDEFSF